MADPYSVVQSAITTGGAFNNAAAQTATVAWPAPTTLHNCLIAIGITDGWDSLDGPNPANWATSAPAGWTQAGIHHQQGQTVSIWYILNSSVRSGNEVFNLGWDFINGSDYSISLMEISGGAVLDTAGVFTQFAGAASFSAGQVMTGVSGATSGIVVGAITGNGATNDPPQNFGAAPPSGTLTSGKLALNSPFTYLKQGGIRGSIITSMNAAGILSDPTIYSDTGPTNIQLAWLRITASAGDPGGGGGSTGGAGLLLALWPLWNATPGSYPAGDNTGDSFGRNTTQINTGSNRIAIAQSANTILVEPKF